MQVTFLMKNYKKAIKNFQMMKKKENIKKLRNQQSKIKIMKKEKYQISHQKEKINRQKANYLIKDLKRLLILKMVLKSQCILLIFLLLSNKLCFLLSIFHSNFTNHPIWTLINNSSWLNNHILWECRCPISNSNSSSNINSSNNSLNILVIIHLFIMGAILNDFTFAQSVE